MKTILLSLDLATKTGWALGDAENGDPVSGVVTSPKSGAERGPFFHYFGHWLRSTIAEHDVSVVVYEEPIMPTGMVNFETLMKLYGLAALTETVCHSLGVKCYDLPAGTWKKAFCGKAGFGKPKTAKERPSYPPLVRCRELGWSPQDDNEADALGLWVASVQRLSPRSSVRFDPIFRQQQAA